MSTTLPDCGVYLTRAPIGQVPAGRFVYFHNHGNPGPGVYLPSTWRGNRAIFQARGHTLEDDSQAADLMKLPAQGFYRVAQPFDCCDKRCRTFEVNTLVQLGYDAAGNLILFLPQFVDGAMALPERGTRIEMNRVAALNALKVAISDTPLHEGEVDDIMLH